MPGTLLRTRGPRGFQAAESHPITAMRGRSRNTLAQLQEVPKISESPVLGSVTPGVNVPVSKLVLSAAEPIVEEEEEVKEVPAMSESGEEDEVEEPPPPPRKPKKSAEQKKLEQKFVIPKEPEPEPEKKKRKPKKKVEVESEGEEEEVVVEKKVKPKATRKLSEWQLFMKEAKDFDSVKAVKGPEKIREMARLYKERKAAREVKKEPEVVSL